MNRKIIIFEEVRSVDRWLISWYLWRKYEVQYVRLSRNAEEAKFLSVFAGKIEQIAYARKPTTHDGYYYDDAFETIDAFFHNFKAKSIFKRMSDLYKNDAVILAFKKAFNDKLARFYYHNHFMHSLSERYRNADLTFIPSNGIQGYRTEDCDIYDYFKIYAQAKTIGTLCYRTSSLKFPLWAAAISYGNALIRKCKELGKIIVFLGWCFFKAIIAFKNRPSLKAGKYKYAFNIIAPGRQFANDIQKVDFLVDGNLIKKEEVIFLSYTKLDQNARAYLKEHELDYLDDLGIFVSTKEIRRIIPETLLLLLAFVKEGSWTIQTSLKGLYFYAIWESLACNICTDKFIAHSGYEIKSIFRNIILQKHGCCTYQYMDTTNFGYFFTSTKSKEKKSFLLGFLYGDYFITWNDEATNFFKFIQFHFKHYVNLGCLWAEHVKLVSQGKIKSTISEKLNVAGYKPGMKIISIFDTTYNDDAHTTYSDAIVFIQGIYSLIQDFPDVFFIIKEKKLRNYHQVLSAKHEEINALYEKFNNIRRCYLPGVNRNPSEIIAISHLTVSSPFTSTTYEALAARKKALWYDASGKFRQSFYDSMPGLVCHNYAELLSRVKELLYKTSDEEYNHYLDTHVKGKVESYLDGKAITRFRKLLNNSLESPQHPINDAVLITESS